MSAKPESEGAARRQGQHPLGSSPAPRPAEREPVQRSQRLSSHALVDIKTNRWNPFSRRSAVLLDLSETGFKVEFTSNVNVAIDALLHFRLPLSPFGIFKPAELRLIGKVVWFDATTMRAGGTFQTPQPLMQQALGQLIAALQKKPV